MIEEEFNKVSTINLELTEEQRTLLNTVDEVCKKIRPVEDRCYLEGRFNESLKDILSSHHLLGIPISKKYGDGQGADTVTYALVLERIGEEGTGVRTFLSVHTSLCQLTIQQWGTEEQKDFLLTKGTKGEIVFAFGLTEPNAGSDPASLSTSFEEKDGKYVIKGQKMWISNGSIADYVIVFAYPKGRREGMCAFIVNSDSPGFISRRIENKMGLPTSDTATIYLDNVEVPRDMMLGQNGKGLSVAYSALMNGRLSVAAGCVGVIRDCLKEMLKYSSFRVQHGKPIAKHQLIQRHIAIVSSELEASSLLVLKAAYMKQKYMENPSNIELRDEADRLIATAKYYAANASFDAANRAVQVFGANGYSLENRPARHLLDTRVTMIYEGTNEILEQKIAVSLLGREYEAYR
jgi:alkylation response protein AidB-like acyl-CoA dehydrogenase